MRRGEERRGVERRGHPFGSVSNRGSFRRFQKMPLYDEIDIEDMKWNEKEQCFTYACPCGDLFAISLEDLRAGEEMATCPSCTLFIQVIYNEVCSAIGEVYLQRYDGRMGDQHR